MVTWYHQLDRRGDMISQTITPNGIWRSKWVVALIQVAKKTKAKKPKTNHRNGETVPLRWGKNGGVCYWKVFLM